MEQAPTLESQTPENPIPAPTMPQTVWTTLTALQQQAVGRIVVRVCQELAAHWIDRKGGEYHADR